MNNAFSHPFESLVSRLPAGSTVLLAGAGPSLESESALLRRMGIEFEVHAAETTDLRLTAWPASRFEAISWEEANPRYRAEEVQRVIALFFKALKPRGWGSFPYDPNLFSKSGYHSMLRQNGFQVHSEWTSNSWNRVLAQRL